MTETRFPTGISGRKNDDLDIWSDSDIALYPQGNIWISQGTKLIFEGTIPDDYEIKLQATTATADRDIILPDANGTVAVSVSDTTTTVQGELNLDFTLSSAGNISATGTVYGLAGTDSPTFTGLTINGSSIIFEGSVADNFETTLTVTNPTADRTITFPDSTGTVALLGSLSVGTEGVASGDGGIAYNNTTGVFTYTPPTPAGIGAATLTSFSVGAEGVASGDGGIAYNNTTGVFTYTPPDLSSYLTAIPANISVTTASISSTLTLTLLNTAPASPVNGMIAASDGTGWNPAGDGLQHINAYINGAWVQIA